MLLAISGILKASYKCDFAGREAIRALSGGITIHSVFSSAGNRIAEYNEATGALIREYVWFNGAPLAVIEGGMINFIRTDNIGRPVFGTNTAGTKVWTAAYLPFGGVRTSTGTPITARFPGQWFQSESGLHQNWMRDYDPTTGRYLQADPLGLVDGASVYGYVKANPGRYVDPKGEQSIRRTGPMSTPGGGVSLPTAGNYSDAWQKMLQWSHNYNPIDLLLQTIVAACTADGPWCTYSSYRIDYERREKLCVYDCPNGSQRSIFVRGLVTPCPAVLPLN